MTVVSLAHVKLSHARALVRWEGLKIYKEEDRAESCGQLSRSDRTRQNCYQTLFPIVLIHLTIHRLTLLIEPVS